MNNVVERAKNIVLTPKTEWPVIDAEPTSIQEIYRGYLVPLALVPAVAGLIGASIVGMSIPGLGTVRLGFAAGLMQAILQFGLSLAMVYVLALIIDLLAPTFGAPQNRLAAFKVAAYSVTPAWLAGIFSAIPVLSIFIILGLYAIYLLYLGLPRLMRAPADKAIGYTAVVVIVGLVLSVMIAVIGGAILS
jgi:Yip1 domain